MFEKQLQKFVKKVTILSLALILLSVGACDTAQAQEQKVALVIGNSNYKDNNLNLKNPVNDANAIYKTLKDLGFDVQKLLVDANRQEMEEAIQEFQNRLKKASVGVFYYSGHGVQVDGKNYLVPVDAHLSSEVDAQFQAVELQEVIKQMKAANTQVNVLIIDACRTNDFYKRWNPTRGSNPQGLAAIIAPRGTLIAYATGPGQVAQDGGKNNHSPYTESLLKRLPTPRISILDMLSYVAYDVAKATSEKQNPYVEGNLGGIFSFNPNPTTAPSDIHSSSEDTSRNSAVETPRPSNGMNLLAYVVVGLIVGVIAKAIYPGHQGGGILGSILLGIIGTFVGGSLGYFFTTGNFAIAAASLSIPGIAVAIMGAIVAIFLWNLMTRNRTI